ncbi:MAG: sugar ABC transporter permease [Epulopiscium sp. Nele67-Bin004]|nr:MAG: sugar ABC transporter permease [Epulopiscium sp. Nele67-Bin004]
MANTSKLAQETKALNKSMRKYWDLYILLIPVIIYYIVFKYGPMYGLQIAFKDFSIRKGYFGSDWVGFEHFIRFFNRYDFWDIMFNTFKIAFTTMIFTFPLPICLALLINEIQRKRMKHLLQNVTYMPHFLSTVVVVGMMITMVSPSTGIINKIIQFFGGEAIYFMAKPEWFLPLYVISDIWKSTGWSSIIYVSALSGISVELYEAAEIDGANRWAQLRYITLPCLKPTMIIMLILESGNIMSVGFEKIFLMQTDLTLSVSQVISTTVYDIGIKSGQFDYATAIDLFNSLINFTLLIVVNHLSKKFSETSLW